MLSFHARASALLGVALLLLFLHLQANPADASSSGTASANINITILVSGATRGQPFPVDKYTSLVSMDKCRLSRQT